MLTVMTLRNAVLVGFAAAVVFFGSAVMLGQATPTGAVLTWCAVGAQALPIVYLLWERVSAGR